MSNDFAKVGPKQQILTMWVIWFAIPTGLFIMDRFAVQKREIDEAAMVDGISLFGLVGIGIILLAAVVRWFVIPRIQTAQAGLVAMVIGLALSEFPGMLSMFVIPAEHVRERTLLFALSYASALTFAPFYAKRLCREATAPTES